MTEQLQSSDPDHGTKAQAELELALDVDEEHTKLLIYRHAFAAASSRDDFVAELVEAFSRITAPHDGGPDSSPNPAPMLVEMIERASTELMMQQAACRSAIVALSQPIQRSLSEFVA
jgi:hypothetical protein